MTSSAKDKRGCWGQWFWTLKEKKAIHMKMEKQTCYKQMFVGPGTDNGTERNFNKQTLLSSCMFTLPTSYKQLLFSREVMSDSFGTPWTLTLQAPLSIVFSRQEHWSGLPFPFAGDLPNPGIEFRSPTLAGRFFTTEAPGKPY